MANERALKTVVDDSIINKVTIIAKISTFSINHNYMNTKNASEYFINLQITAKSPDMNV